MNSQTLKQNGFSEPFLLKSVSFSNLPANKSSVFVIADTTLTETAPSDILYIGRSKRPIRRILGGYLAGYGGKTNKRINSNLFNDGYIDKAAIYWMLTDKPKAMQQDLIDKFVLEHGELPLWNSSTKKKQVKVEVKAAPEPKLKAKRKPVPKAAPAKTARARRAKKTKPAKPAAAKESLESGATAVDESSKKSEP
jgi:hypothetical protein